MTAIICSECFPEEKARAIAHEAWDLGLISERPDMHLSQNGVTVYYDGTLIHVIQGFGTAYFTFDPTEW